MRCTLLLTAYLAVLMTALGCEDTAASHVHAVLHMLAVAYLPEPAL